MNNMQDNIHYMHRPQIERLLQSLSEEFQYDLCPHELTLYADKLGTYPLTMVAQTFLSFLDDGSPFRGYFPSINAFTKRLEN